MALLPLDLFNNNLTAEMFYSSAATKFVTRQFEVRVASLIHGGQLVEYA